MPKSICWCLFSQLNTKFFCRKTWYCGVWNKTTLLATNYFKNRPLFTGLYRPVKHLQDWLLTFFSKFPQKELRKYKIAILRPNFWNSESILVTKKFWLNVKFRTPICLIWFEGIFIAVSLSYQSTPKTFSHLAIEWNSWENIALFLSLKEWQLLEEFGKTDFLFIR